MALPFVDTWPFLVAAFGIGAFVQQIKSDIRVLKSDGALLTRRVTHLESDMHYVKSRL